MTISMQLGKDSYLIHMEHGILSGAGKILDLNRRVLVITDDGVPSEYARVVANQCAAPVVVTVPQGESSKSFAMLEHLCRQMLQSGFTRKDCVVAVGGGVVGDLSGFAAASYMRGIDFYNIPTTLLSQVDSSIGGKVAVNLDSIKNIVGAFYQPKAVLVDPEVLKTLPSRQISNGLAESIKMSVTSDAGLFHIFETQNIHDYMDEIIERSLQIKRDVVEQDEKEQGLRRILNFGHTIGHGIESSGHLGDLLHGECVALGMLPLCSESVRTRLIPVLKKAGLPVEMRYDKELVWQAMQHDKKAAGGKIAIVYVPEIGKAEIQEQTPEELKNNL